MNKKVWFVTGASSGLGERITEFALENNNLVIGTSRNLKNLDHLKNKFPKDFFPIELDLTKSNEINLNLNKISSEIKGIDVLVNNAGFGTVGAIEEISEEKNRESMEIHYFSPIKLIKLFLPYMREKKSGSIIQISSHSGFKSTAGFGIYSASKFALEGFTEALHQELSPLGIHVHLVELGPFRTNFAGSNLYFSEKTISDYSNTVGAFKERIKSVNGKQEGDPIKAAEIIYNLVQNKSNDLRLVLGKIALQTFETKLKEIRENIDRNKTISESVVFG